MPVPVYPDLNTELPVAIAMLEDDPEVFDFDDCPYGPGVVDALRGLKADEVVDFGKEPKDKWEKLEIEAAKLYKELQESKTKLTDVDHAERMSYFRTATSLLEKLVGLQERTVGLRAIGAFQQTVLDIMEDVLDAGQRTEVMQRLEKAVRGE